MTKARDIASAAPAPSTVSATELGYLDGVSSAIQTQIDSKIGSASAISPTLIDAKGDLIVGSAADTAARLAVGTNDYVLTADSSATNGVKWAAVAAGSMTLLSTTSLSSGSSITVSNINQTYQSLYILVQRANISSSGGLQIKPNAANIAHNSYLINATAANLTYGGIVLAPTSLTLSASETFNGWSIYIDNYTDTASDRTKPFNCYGQYYRNNDTLNSINNAGGIFTSGAITSLEILPSTGNFQGGTMFIYGVK